MSSNWQRLAMASEMRRAYQVAYSVRMIGDIASRYDAALDAQEFLTAQCMLDAFYVHIRLLADFLVKPTKEKDFGPREFGVEWPEPHGEAADNLRRHWQVASQYVVHFGRPRVPENIDDLRAFNVGGSFFRSIATDALAVFGLFLEALDSATADFSDGARIPDPDREPKEWRARVMTDVLDVLRDAHHYSELALTSQHPGV